MKTHYFGNITYSPRMKVSHESYINILYTFHNITYTSTGEKNNYPPGNHHARHL